MLTGICGVPILFDGSPYGGQIQGTGASISMNRSLSVGDFANVVPKVPNTSSSIKTQGDMYLTRATGNVYDPTLHINTTNAYATLQYELNGALKAIVQYGLGNMYYLITGVGVHDFRTNGVPTATIDAVSGFRLKVGSIGYATGAGGAVTQITSRTTGVTLNKACGQIMLLSAAGSAAWQTFTVTNSLVAATDVIRVNQASGTDLNMIHVTNVAAGSFKISFASTGGTTTEQPVFNFAITKAVAA